MPTRVKICCISSVEEARLAIRYGASALGLVSDMPSGPGIISDDLICSFASSVPPYVSSVLLTSRQDVEGIVEQHRHCRTNVIQIVDTLKGRYEELQDRLPGVDLVQVVHGGEMIRFKRHWMFPLALMVFCWILVTRL